MVLSGDSGRNDHLFSRLFSLNFLKNPVHKFTTAVQCRKQTPELQAPIKQKQTKQPLVQWHSQPDSSVSVPWRQLK